MVSGYLAYCPPALSAEYARVLFTSRAPSTDEEVDEIVDTLRSFGESESANSVLRSRGMYWRARGNHAKAVYYFDRGEASSRVQSISRSTALCCCYAMLTNCDVPIYSLSGERLPALRSNCARVSVDSALDLVKNILVDAGIENSAATADVAMLQLLFKAISCCSSAFQMLTALQ